MSEAIKFPKTPRLSAMISQDLSAWRSCQAVVEEKVDGANVGVWFEGQELRLQSRGHVLRGGAGERQFAPLHAWAAERLAALRSSLGTRFVLYGEWCFAKHRAFYDALPDWFLGLDILDKETGAFFPTPARDVVFSACSIRTVPRLYFGKFGQAPAFGSFIAKSRLKTPGWREILIKEAERSKVKDPMSGTDDSDQMEGVYVRIEDGMGVVGRMKAHRPGFEKVRNDDWRSGPLIRNAIA